MLTATATIQDLEVFKNFDWTNKTQKVEAPGLPAARMKRELIRDVRTQDSSDVVFQIKKPWLQHRELLLVEYGQKSADLTYQIEEVMSWLWRNHVKIPERNEVYNYLIKYPDMADILPLICNSLRERFPLPAELSLEVYHDPEIEDEHLMIYVRLDKYNDQVMDAIDEVCEKFEAERAESSGWLIVTTDFQPPNR